MPSTRREFIPFAAAALAAPAILSGTAFAQERSLLLQPITPTTGQKTPYARFANQGPLGRPSGPIRVEPVAGLRVDLWLPPNQREARLVVFSHAELVLPGSYDALLGHWASHGFAVAAPLHDDSILVNGLRAHQEDIHGGKWDLGTVINDADGWSARPRACRAILDLLPKLEQASGVRFLDERPIIAGHSFGAFAAQLLIGTRAALAAGGTLNETDPRFYAAILMSPQGRGILGLKDGSWDGVARPLIAITGNGDTDATGQDPNVKLEPFALSPPGNKHLAWMSHILQTLYAGQQVSVGTNRGDVFQDLLGVTTAFLHAYADYDADTFAILAGDYFTKATDGRMDMRYR